MRTLKRIVVLSVSLLLANAVLADDFQAGMDAYNSADYETAIAKWQPLADAGDARGCYGMGLLYGNGFGVMMDDAQAMHWYGLAADGGHGDAANKLGVMHQNGLGCTHERRRGGKVVHEGRRTGSHRRSECAGQPVSGRVLRNVRSAKGLHVVCDRGEAR